MGLEREHRFDHELTLLLDELARPAKSDDVPGKRTRVQQLIERLIHAPAGEREAVIPGRRTLVERVLAMAGTLQFDDLRVLALRETLAAIGPKENLHRATIAAADPAIARRATPDVPRSTAGAGGRAMWRASERRATTLYRQAADAGEVASEDPAVDEALARAGGGAPLPAALRRRMEDELGVSLARVRVHTDAVAAQAARAIRAEAFTVGEDIFFAEHAWAPDTQAGQKLIAHELAHVVQGWQGRGDASETAAGRISQPGDTLEREADAVAERVARGDRTDPDGVAERVARGDRTAPARRQHADHAGGAPQRADRIDHAGPAPQRADRTDAAQRADHADAAPRADQAAASPRADRAVGEPSVREPAASARPAARPLQRKPAEKPQAQRSDAPYREGTIKPQIQPAIRRVPSGKQRPVDNQAAMAQALGNQKKAIHHAFAPLKKTAHDAKHKPIGHATKAKTRQEHHEADAHIKKAHADAKHHHGEADKHKNAKHDDATGVPPPPKLDPSSPIQFKKITDWSKYLPPPMPDQDERERKHLIALIKNKIIGEQVAAQKILGSLHEAQLKQADALRAMKPALKAQIAAAQAGALGQVAASEASQAAAVTAAFASAKSRVTGAAAAAKGKVNAAYAAAINGITTANQTAADKLTQGQDTARTGITSAETSQITVVQGLYNAAHATVASNGASEASFAAGLADSVPLPYSGDKLDAAKKAAHGVADGWAKDIPGKMQEDAASNIYNHQSESEQGVHDFAKQQQDQVKQLYDNLKKALDAAHDQAKSGAESAKSGAIAQIDAMLSSTLASLSAQSASQVAAVHANAASARAGIIKAGQASQAAVAAACDGAAADLEKGAAGLVAGAKQVEAPSPEYTQKAVADAEKKLKTAATTTIGDLKKQASGSAQDLSKQAADAAKGMAAIAASAKQAANQAAQGAVQSLNKAATSAATSLHKMQEGFEKQAQKIGETADTKFKELVDQTKTVYQGSTEKLRSGLDSACENLKTNYHTCISEKETEQIKEEAKKAADAVKPWWQRALAFVLTVVVVIVIMVAVTVLTAGLGTGPMAIVIGVAAGAAAGAVSSVASQVVENLVMGEPAFNIDWKEVGISALAGAITGGFAAGAGEYGGAAVSAAMQGAKGLGNYAIRFSVNAGAGMIGDVGAHLAIDHHYDLDMKNLVINLGFSAVASHSAVVGAQNKLGDNFRARVGKDPIHGGGPEGGPRGGEGPSGHGPGNELGGAHPEGNSHVGNELGGKPTGVGKPGGPDGNGPGANPNGNGPKHAAPEPTGSHPEPTTHPTGEGGGGKHAAPDDNGGGGKHRAPEDNGNGGKPDGDGGKHRAPEDNGNGGKPEDSNGGKHRAPDDDNGGKHAADDDNGGKHRSPDDDNGGKHAPDDDNGGKHRAPDDDNGGKHAADDDSGGKHRAPDDDSGGKHAADDDKGGKHRAPDDDKGGKHAADDGKGGKHADDNNGNHHSPDDHGKSPNHDDHPSRSREQQAHDEARDSELEADGYTQGTRAKADRAAAEIEAGQTPKKENLRDTEANQKGREDLDKLLKDRRLTPEERTAIEKKIADELRAKPDPTGNLDRDVRSGAHKAAEELDAAATARAKAAGKKPDEIPSGLTQQKIDEILGTPKGQRPDPKDYLPPEYVKAQLAKFDDGAARFMTEENLNKYGIGQRDGTSFVMPKAEADALLASAHGDPSKLEEALGLPKGFLESNKLVRVDIPKPDEHGLRIPSGNEAGANDQWLPSGKLPTGNNEGVIDAKGMTAGKDYVTSPVKMDPPTHVDPPAHTSPHDPTTTPPKASTDPPRTSDPVHTDPPKASDPAHTDPPAKTGGGGGKDADPPTKTGGGGGKDKDPPGGGDKTKTGGDPPKKPGSFEELQSHLSPKAKEALDQARQLRSAENLKQMESIGRNPDGTYDIDKANAAWERMHLSPDKFQKAVNKHVAQQTEKAKERIEAVNNLANETDGTNRPNATVGDGTSEAALRQEAETGVPVGNVDGHAEKVQNAIDTFKDSVQRLEHLKGQVTDPKVRADIEAAIRRANERIAKMEPALDIWNNRVKLFPNIWNPDGTPKIPPPRRPSSGTGPTPPTP